ncbi:diadenosine tetraphosphate (Ap4A) hydrolase and other HIT family hydrolases [Firmicutes bacterium CAG:475]|jgi:histidine triad (HIT) family protein|nr:histidine triad nucleotide-binding protein [Clostridia bacterium]CDD69318.1 diadenosine tetraphosphate (Ap4A) hydrolase and other HIT family hydrolases [Firmicutes bacterium CAG:475]
MDNCIFCKIVKGDIPSAKVYEDEDMIIIKDLNPQAPVHLLLIPKEHYANIVEMSDAQAQTLAKCLKKLSTLTDKLGLQNGFRLVSNKGEDGCQSVGHLHIHILGGRKLSDTMC